MPVATFLRDKWMEYAVTTGDVATARPTAWHVALHSDDPGASGAANEISGSSYARVDVTADVSLTSGVATVDVSVVFPTVTSTGYDVTHVSLWSATSAGNCLFYGALAIPKSLAVGEAAVFATGELSFTVV